MKRPSYAKTAPPKRCRSILSFCIKQRALKLASLLGYDNSASSQSSYASNYCDTLNAGVRRTLGIGSCSVVSRSLSVNGSSVVVSSSVAHASTRNGEGYGQSVIEGEASRVDRSVLRGVAVCVVDLKSDLAVALDVAVVELALINSDVGGSAVRVCSSNNYVGDGQTGSLS